MKKKMNMVLFILGSLVSIIAFTICIYRKGDSLVYADNQNLNTSSISQKQKSTYQDVSNYSQINRNSESGVNIANNGTFGSNSLIRATSSTVQIRNYLTGTYLGSLSMGPDGVIPTTSISTALFNAKVSNIGLVTIGGNDYYIVASDGHSVNPLLPDSGTWFWGSTATSGSDYNTFVTTNATGLANGSIFLRAIPAVKIKIKNQVSGEFISTIDLRNSDDNLYSQLNQVFNSVGVGSTGVIGLERVSGERDNYTMVAADGTSTNPLLPTGRWIVGSSLTNSATLLDLLANHGEEMKAGTVYLQVKISRDEGGFLAPFSEKTLDFGQDYNWEMKASLNSGLGVKNDIAFVFDTTGSVAGYIANFADALGGDGVTDGFVDKLVRTGGTDNRYAVANFGDYQADGATTWFFKNYYLTERLSPPILGDGSGLYSADTPTELENVKKNMSRYRSTSGGDTPEDSIYATMRMMDEIRWRPNTKRILVLLTDTSSKTRPTITVGGYPVSLAGMQGLAASKGIKLIWLGTGYSNDETMTSGNDGQPVSTLTSIQTAVNYNFMSINYRAASTNSFNDYTKLLNDTVLLLNGDKSYKYTYKIDRPVYVSDGAPSTDISSLTITPSASTTIKGTESPNSTSDGVYFNLDNVDATHLNGAFNVHATTVANPLRSGDKTKVVIHYYRNGIEQNEAKQTLYLGPVPPKPKRTTLRAIPNFDFGLNNVSSTEVYNLAKNVIESGSAGTQLDPDYNADTISSSPGSIQTFLNTGMPATPTKRAIVLTDGQFDKATGWQVEAQLTDLQTDTGQRINDPRVKIKLNSNEVAGITDLGSTQTSSIFASGSMPSVFQPELVNGASSSVVMNSHSVTDSSDNAVGSWMLKYNSMDSAQLTFPNSIFKKIPAGRNVKIKGTIVWTLLSRTP